MEDLNVAFSQIKTYPNPVRNEIYIKETENNTSFNVKVFNLLGKKMIDTKQLENIIDVAHLKESICLTQNHL